MSNPREELTSEMISNMTLTQLHFILTKISQLSFHCPEQAKKFLKESPQLSLALIHAQYLVSSSSLDSRLLPLTADEVKIARERLKEIESGHGVLVGPGTGVSADVGLNRRRKNLENIQIRKLIEKLSKNELDCLLNGLNTNSNEIDKIVLNLTNEQILNLPENISKIILKLLE
jgi:hypothetical protein